MEELKNAIKVERNKIAVVDTVTYNIKKFANRFSIATNKWYDKFDNMIKPLRTDGKVSFVGDAKYSSNKNITFEYEEESNTLTIIESNKIKQSLAKTVIELSDDTIDWIAVFSAESMFVSPAIGVRGGFDNIKLLTDNLEEWLVYDGISSDNSIFVLNIAKEITINDAKLDVIPTRENIDNVFMASASETIIPDDYGDVIYYESSYLGIKMIATRVGEGKVETTITLGGTIIYRATTDGHMRLPITKELLDEFCNLGIYKKEEDRNVYYVENESIEEENKRILEISIEGDTVNITTPNRVMNDRGIMATMTPTNLQFVSKYVSASQTPDSYVDTFTFAKYGVLYYNDLSDDYLYCRDVFGVPYLNTAI